MKWKVNEKRRSVKVSRWEGKGARTSPLGFEVEEVIRVWDVLKQV